jgi:uncharacterized protein YcfJ
MPKRLIAAMLVLCVSLGLFICGCETSAQSGGLIGAGVGALAGQAIGHDTKSTVIGTAVGAGAGYVVGNEMDKSKERENK